MNAMCHSELTSLSDASLLGSKYELMKMKQTAKPGSDRSNQSQQTNPTNSSHPSVSDNAKDNANYIKSESSIVHFSPTVPPADDSIKKEKIKKKMSRGFSTHIASFDPTSCRGEINSQLSLPSGEFEGVSEYTYINHFPYDPLFESLVRRAEAAMADGVLPELISSGSSGSYFIKDHSHNILAVFKPRDEEPYGPANPKWGKYFQRNCCPCCFGRSCLPLNHGYLSEAGASLIDEKLGLNIVPKTKVLMLYSTAFNYYNSRRCCCFGKVKKMQSVLLRKNPPPKIGSFQLFVSGYKDAWTMLQHFVKKPLSPETEKDFCIEFQKLTVLDYIIRNTDRGHDNWLLKYESSSISSCDPRVLLAAIDNGLAFPFKHPDEWRKYPFYWALLPRAKLPYSREIKESMLPMLENEDFVVDLVESLFSLFRVDKNFQHFIFEKQMSVMRGQITNLIEALKEGVSPAEMVVKPPLTIETQLSKHGEMLLRPSLRKFPGSPFFSKC